MKKKPEFKKFLILFIMFSSELFAQNIDGIWFASYSMEINKNSYRTDTIYENIFSVLDFLNSKNVILKTPKKDLENFTYSLKNGELKLKKDAIKITGTVADNQIILIDTLDDFTTKKIFLERLKPSQLNLSQIPDSTMFFNSCWTIESDTNSENYGVKFNFLDRDSLDSFKKHRVTITKNRGSYGYTENGIYSILSYKNHFFLGIFNKESLEENVYHFYKKDKYIFYTDTYEYSFIFNGKNPPKLNKIKFVKTKYLSSKQKINLESKLKGKWKAINNPISLDSISSKYKKLENQSFEITFKDNNEYELYKSGILINKNIRVPKNIIITGKWKISETGNYIYLKPDNSWGKYLTIGNVTSDSLKIYYNIESLEGKHNITYPNLIELIK